MRIQKTLAITAAVLGLVLVAQLWFSVHTHTPVSTEMVAIWQENPQSLEDLEALADEIIIGKVVDIRHAEDMRPLDAENFEGMDDVSLPVEVITIEVSTQLKGRKRSKTETIQLFHMGHSDLNLARKKAPPASERPEKPDKGAVKKADAPKFDPGEVAVAIPMTLHDDPAYKIGEKYAWFVQKGRQLKVKGKMIETLVTVHPSGRLRISKDKKVKPVFEYGFVAKLKGKKVDDLKAEIAEIRKGKPKKGN